MLKRMKRILICVVAANFASISYAHATQDYVEMNFINLQPKQVTLLAVGADYLLAKYTMCVAGDFSESQGAKIAFISEPVIGDAERALAKAERTLDYYRSFMVTVFWAEPVTVNFDAYITYPKRCSLN